MHRSGETIWDVVARWAEETQPQLQPGSAAADDRTSAPDWDPFTAAWGAWEGAVDHLEVLRDMVETSGTLYTSAPWSLLRITIENAALSIWLLQPDTTAERVTRRLQIAWGDWSDAAKVESSLRTNGSSPWSTEQQQHVKDAGRRLNLDLSVVCGKWNWAGIVRTAGSAGNSASPESAEIMWRICSGFAHASEWPRILWLDVDVSEPDAADRVRVSMSSSIDRFYEVLSLAFELAARARQQMGHRRLRWVAARS